MPNDNKYFCLYLITINQIEKVDHALCRNFLSHCSISRCYFLGLVFLDLLLVAILAVEAHVDPGLPAGPLVKDLQVVGNVD